MVKILVVGARGIPDVEGGVEKNTERLFPLVSAAGWDVTLIGLKEHISSESFQGVKLLSAPSVRFLKTDKLVYYMSAVFTAIRLRPDIVHMQGLGAAIMLWAYKLIGAKTVVRYGLADYLVPKWGRIGRLGFIVSEYQLRFADAVIAVTPALRDRLADRKIERNVHVISNAVDSLSLSIDSGSWLLPTKPYILAVGRVTSQKNLKLLIEGFKKFSRMNPGYRLAIAGGLDDACYVDELRTIIDETIMLLGALPRSSLPPVYANAHLYVNSSTHEGSSNAVFEAVSWGAPVLLSDIPENRDFGLCDRHYFSPHDPDSICGALLRAVDDREAYVVDPKRFQTWEEVAEKTMKIYESFGLRSGGGVGW